MRITNVHHLPAAIVEAVRNDPYPRERSWDFSATELIAPPQLLALKRRHDAELEEDAADRIWALFGQSIHAILERAEPTALTETRLYGRCGTWNLSGQFDRLVALDPQARRIRIEDYKTTSVWSVLAGAKAEWVDQLHVLQWLAEQNGYRVGELAIVALLRDWSRGKALDGSPYPPAPVVTLRVPLADPADLDDWLAARVQAHLAARAALEQGQAPAPCTAAERWERPPLFAVRVPGRKSAVRLHAEPAAASDHARALKNGYVEHRPGAPVRCTGYCPVAGWCPQRQAELAAALDLAA